MNQSLTSLALQDTPALIESVFPAQKVSFEAQRERKAGAGQTLTALGSYWKGRKPLILVRAIVLGSLLPPTDDTEGDLEIFEKLMAFDDEGLARRALAANAFSDRELQERWSIADPERYFSGRGWRRDVSEDDKLALYRKVLVVAKVLGSTEDVWGQLLPQSKARHGLGPPTGLRYVFIPLALISVHSVPDCTTP
jgi:hypothetical protein